jgi:hypothetical protein
MNTFIFIVVIVIVVLVIYFCFNYYSATKGIIKANLNSFFAAKREGMNSENAIHFMIQTRYGVLLQKRSEFVQLYALFLSFLERPENSKMSFPDAFDVLSIVFDSFDLHHEIPENVGEREKEELEMLRRVICLMHIYEAGTIFKSSQSVNFPTIKFLDNFIYNIDKEYYNNMGKTLPNTG